MKIAANILAFLAALALLSVLVWAGYLGLRFLVTQLWMIDAREMPILVIASTVFLAGAILIATAVRTSLQRNDKQVHSEKVVLYSNIVKAWDTYEGDRKMLSGQLSEWHVNMILWAGDEVLKQVRMFHSTLTDPEQPERAVKDQAGKLILAIRNDIGHKNRGLRTFWVTESLR